MRLIVSLHEFMLLKPINVLLVLEFLYYLSLILASITSKLPYKMQAFCAV